MENVQAYEHAIRTLLPLPDLQREILDALLSAHPGGMTAGQLAKLLGCRNQVVVNGAFGRLAHAVYKIIGVHPEGLSENEFQWWHILATTDTSGLGFRWILRVEVVAALANIGFGSHEADYPEECPAASPLLEGAPRQALVNAYERNPIARRRCVDAHGESCVICGFNFALMYGPETAGNIHVHHLTPLSEVGAEYEVDPVSDLRPVCPNCHAVIHMSGSVRSIEQVQEMIVTQRRTA